MGQAEKFARDAGAQADEAQLTEVGKVLRGGGGEPHGLILQGELEEEALESGFCYYGVNPLEK